MGTNRVPRRREAPIQASRPTIMVEGSVKRTRSVGGGEGLGRLYSVYSTRQMS